MSSHKPIRPLRLSNLTQWAIIAVVIVLFCPSASAQDSNAAAAGAKAAPGTEEVDVHRLFATKCSWCHAAYGMQADKGPRLAGTSLSESEIGDLLRNGKDGAMPSFRKQLTDTQISAIAKYIKDLKAE
jgi:mono/diheme cytochrome c family protein